MGVLFVLYLASRQYASFDVIVEREAALRTWLEQHPWRGFGVGFAIYVAVSLIPGTTGKALVAGWFYGYWLGLIIVNVGLTVAALMSFSVSRYLWRDFVTARCGPRLTRINAGLERDGAGYLFIARVLHVPYCLTNYLMGATRIHFRGFWWATQLGLLPGNLVFVYAGVQAPTLGEIRAEGLSALFSPTLIAAFVAISIVPLIIRSIVRRIVVSRARRRADGG